MTNRSVMKDQFRGSRADRLVMLVARECLATLKPDFSALIVGRIITSRGRVEDSGIIYLSAGAVANGAMLDPDAQRPSEVYHREISGASTVDNRAILSRGAIIGNEMKALC